MREEDRAHGVKEKEPHQQEEGFLEEVAEPLSGPGGWPGARRRGWAAVPWVRAARSPSVTREPRMAGPVGL